MELKVTLEKLKKLGSISTVIGGLSYFTMIINSVLIYIVKCQMGQ